MLICQICQKRARSISFSRHGRGHGILGQWRLKAPITKKLQRPNLHNYKGMKLCTKCLRTVKEATGKSKPELKPSAQPASV